MTEHTERKVQEPLITGEPPRNIGEQKQESAPIPQYSLGKILLVWAAAAIPMGILGWVVAPALGNATHAQLPSRLFVIGVGLAWQFVLAMILLYREAGNLRWSTLSQRLWLQTPRSPRTGVPNRRLWWWLIPLIILTALLQTTGIIEHAWLFVFPFLTPPAGFDLGTSLATPVARAQLAGAWNILALYIPVALFNTFLGEEILFRGFLMPRMAGVFGKKNWLVNALIFGFYHLHEPWIIPSAFIDGTVFAFPSRTFRSIWFGIIAHSGQSVFFTILILGLVLRWW